MFVTSARGLARTIARRSPLYLQNTIIVGAGDIGQLAARKLLQHPEYGINLVGFVDAHPRPRRPELEHVALVGPADRLTEIISLLDIERVIIAFSDADHEELLRTIRELRKFDVQIDVVPRLFEIVGPKAGIHTFEGLAVVGLPPSRLSPSSRLLKRSLDCVVASAMIVLLAPVMATIAILIRLDSSGPVLFRQRRLGRDMQPFTVLKFRTMAVDTDQEEHRRYIAATLTHDASPNANGLYKLDRSSSVTRVGSILRKTSLDELPQLFNVLARRHVARRPEAVPRLRDRGLRGVPLRTLPDAAGPDGALAGDRARPLDVRRGARHGRRVRARLVVQPRSAATAEDAVLPRPHASDHMTPAPFPAELQHEPARIGVVGLGYWGPNLIRNLNDLEEADLRWICDLDQSRLDTFVRRYPTVRGTRSFEDLIADPDLDAVAIATPVSSHYSLALAALQAGKHVFIEKPLAASVAQAEELAAVAAAARPDADAGPHLPLQPSREHHPRPDQ